LFAKNSLDALAGGALSLQQRLRLPVTATPPVWLGHMPAFESAATSESAAAAAAAAQAAATAADLRERLGQRYCMRQACAIQDCLAKSQYQQSSCAGFIDAFERCCDFVVARYVRANSASATSTRE
jgi:hypothetical protein